MDNIKGLKDYKVELEDCSSDLKKLLEMIPEQKLQSFETEDFVFNITPYNIWNIIQYILVGGSIRPVSFEEKIKEGFIYKTDQGLLNILSYILEDLLKSGLIENCELKEELERALKLIRCLAKTIEHVHFDDECKDDLIGKLFCILLQIILLVIAIIVKIIALLIFCKDKIKHKGIEATFCKCVLCDLSKEMDYAEELVSKLKEIAIELIIICGENKLRKLENLCKEEYGCNCHKHHHHDECHKEEHECECHKHHDDECHKEEHECECHRHHNDESHNEEHECDCPECRYDEYRKPLYEYDNSLSKGYSNSNYYSKYPNYNIEE